MAETTTAGAIGYDPAAHVGGHPTATGVSNNKMAMWVFLGSEFLLFGAFISAYILYLDSTAGGPGVEIEEGGDSTHGTFIGS